MTESVLPTNYALQYTKDTLYSPRVSLRWIHMRDSSTTSTIPNSLYNVQPSSHKTESRIFLSLPYTKKNLKLTNKFNFQFSDSTDTEYVTLCNLLLRYKNCYTTYKNGVGKVSTPFQIRLKPNARLMPQRPPKVPIHNKEEYALLEELENITLSNKLAP